MPTIDLDNSPEWREVAPKADGPELLVEFDGRLHMLKSDGTELRDFGRVGPVDCPVACDPEARIAYRYVCGEDLTSRDFSQIKAYRLDTGLTETLCELPLNQWALWLLRWIRAGSGEGGQLFGLMASDLPIEGQVCLQHRLFAFDPGRPVPRFRSLCRDAYKPLAFSVQRRQLVFSGAEGTYIVSLRGERLSSLAPDILPPADSASFDPTGRNQVVLGSEGLHLWDLDTGHCRRLTRHGRQPVWAGQGDAIWYAESSGELCRYDLEAGNTERILSIKANRYPDFWKSRTVELSACGRYCSVMLSAKRLRGITRKSGGIEKTEKVFEEQDCFCVLDLTARQFWRIEGRFFSAYRWV